MIECFQIKCLGHGILNLTESENVYYYFSSHFIHVLQKRKLFAIFAIRICNIIR